MKISNVEYDGMFLSVPIIGESIMEFASPKFDVYPTRCGAGKGFGDKIVPEKIWGLLISVACDIHDNMWDIAEPTWKDFHESNQIFLSNILSIVRGKSDNFFIEHISNYRAVTYYNAVDTIGALIFWKLKKEQGHEVDPKVFIDIINSLNKAFKYKFFMRRILKTTIANYVPELAGSLL